MPSKTSKAQIVECLQYISGLYQSEVIDMGQLNYITQICHGVMNGHRDVAELFDAIHDVYYKTRNPLAKELLDIIYVG